MTNASRRFGIYGRAHTASTFMLIAVLMVSLFASRTLSATARSQAAPKVWLIERVDIAHPDGTPKEYRRSLRSPSLVIDADERLHLIYTEEFDDRSFHLLYATKVDGAWLTRTIEFNGGANSALALTTNDQLRTSYLADNVARYGQSADGVSWVSQQAITGFNALQSLSSSNLALDSQDRPYIVVGSQESTTPPTYRMSLAVQLGEAWAVQPIADGNGIAPTLAVDSLGKTHVSYLSSRGAGRWAVSYAVLANGIWLTETVGNIDTTPVVVSSHIAVNAGNTPHIAYTNRTRNELVYASRANGAWTRQIITGSVDALDMVLDEASLPHLAYIEPTTPHPLVYAFQSSPGGTWISSTVTAGSEDDPGPPVSIALGPTGLPYIAYIDFTTGDVRVARLGQAVYVPVAIH